MKSRSSYWLLLPYIRPQIATISLALSCTIAFTVFWPILAWLAGRMANYIGEGDVESIAQLAIASAVVFLLRGAVQYGQDTLMAKAALNIALKLRKVAYSHLQKLSLNYFQSAKTGDLTYRLTEDIDRIGEVVNKFFHQFVPCILQLIVVLGYMFYLNWQLTSATLIIAPVMAIIIGTFGEQLLKFSRRSQNRISNLSALLTEVFSGIRLVQAFAAEDYTLQRFTVEAEHNKQAKYLTEKVKALQFVVVGFLEAMSVVFLFFLGAWQISQDNLTGSEFVSYVAAVALLIDPISITTSNYNEFKQGQASVDRIFELLAIKTTIIESKDASELPEITGKVEYKEVSFSYNSEQIVLNNINLFAYPGETIALVGMSGAGKSTLVNLLSRFYDCDHGNIYLDGIDINQVTLKSLRQQIGIVPQETVLFSGTIAENIAFGKTEFELEEIENAAKIANAHQFITELSQGYYTYVGERGVNLSGGQRQRIAIARAILANPRILILDEATSALDSESEALVQEAMMRIMENRTVFVIAHRLGTVKNADKILVLEKGKIIESGTHQELLTLNSRYASFYSQQL
ncbi:MAG: ABC transporter ATP-binding protein [Xenococcaceae cyanobacterium MO_188.B19]|nr:ABC transporter ATP-binding protein [Xenococcaceae cyanobacterium MO_188.B19]